ncbi:hypothetical protein AVEN_60130-1 [Araneus ventricosus]|uniref:Reverse transcriptase domain-containing protein n=1 Tax=Araneus ventricosus TaxID=182803 RepID=A0A4Y2GJM8_ARAVE|nr:hypothetical protein AVEN_60130-1 [Araneus ventricosus]
MRGTDDSLSNSSSTEAGVLTAYHQAMAQSLPKEIRTIIGGRRMEEIKCPNGIKALLQSQAIRNQDKRFPQVSCNRPVQWDIVVEEPLRMQYTGGVHIQTFADDFIMVAAA